MKYIKISNQGEILVADMILLGSSTKRDDSAKIGQFGSGNKFALSWLMRNDCKPIMYSGTTEILLDTTIIEHRGHVREVICVNGEQSSITTEFGMLWKGWMALREFYSNAIDEGSEHFDVVNVSNVEELSNLTNEGMTNIFIPVNTELLQVMENFDHYFAFNRIPDFIHRKGMIYLKEANSQVNVYRKGIRCFDSTRKTMVDFNFNNISITEDRLIEGGEGTFDREARSIVNAVDDVNVLKKVLLSDYLDILPDFNVNVLFVQAYKELIEEGYKFTTKSLRDMLGVFAAKDINPIIIPASHYKMLIDAGIVDNPLEAIFQHLDFNFARVDGPSAEVQEIMSRFGDFKVYFGKMETHHPIKFKDNEIYIKDELAKLSHKEIVGKILINYPEGYKIISTIL